MSCGSQTDQEAAAAGEQFLGDEHGEGGADGSADNADFAAGELEFVELRVVTGPSFHRPGAALSAQASDNIAVRVEDADGWRREIVQSFLPPRFSQQRRRLEDGARKRIFVVEDWGGDHNEPISIASPQLLTALWRDVERSARRRSLAAPRKPTDRRRTPRVPSMLADAAGFKADSARHIVPALCYFPHNAGRAVDRSPRQACEPVEVDIRAPQT